MRKYISTPEKVHNPLEVMQPGEQVIFEIRRHPIGLIYIYGTTGVFLVAVAVMLLSLVPSAFSASAGAGHILAIIVFIITGLMAVIFVILATVIYWGNCWILTTDSLTQVSQHGIFHKSSAQLALWDIENVAVRRHGIIQHFMNYGVVAIETASESGKFRFLYCPNPTSYAQQILDAKEKLVAHNQQPLRSSSKHTVDKIGKTAMVKFPRKQ